MSRPPMMPSGRRHGVKLVVPGDRSPQQAPAVFELHEDLREVICARYLTDIQRAMSASNLDASSSA